MSNNTFLAISNVLSVLLLCLLYGPLFACVNTPRPLLGHITGLLYLLLSVKLNVLFNLYTCCLCSRIATFETYSGVVYTQCDGVTYDGGQVNGLVTVLNWCIVKPPLCRRPL